MVAVEILEKLIGGKKISWGHKWYMTVKQSSFLSTIFIWKAKWLQRTTFWQPLAPGMRRYIHSFFQELSDLAPLSMIAANLKF